MRIGRCLLAARGLLRPLGLRWRLLPGLGRRLRTLLPGHVGRPPLSTERNQLTLPPDRLPDASAGIHHVVVGRRSPQRYRPVPPAGGTATSRGGAPTSAPTQELRAPEAGLAA